jgi:hypothetical protein
VHITVGLMRPHNVVPIGVRWDPTSLLFIVSCFYTRLCVSFDGGSVDLIVIDTSPVSTGGILSKSELESQEPILLLSSILGKQGGTLLCYFLNFFLTGAFWECILWQYSFYLFFSGYQLFQIPLRNLVMVKWHSF